MFKDKIIYKDKYIMIKDEFSFHSKLDYVGCDLINVKDKTIDQLKEICIYEKRCIGFNTLGYFKYYVDDDKLIKLNSYESDGDGIYIYKKRYDKLKKRILAKCYMNFDGYKFYRNKDSCDNDIKFTRCKSLEELKELCDDDPLCDGFNTLGFLKNRINCEKEFINLNRGYFDGLYVKNKKFRVKMLCDWCDSKSLCDDWSRMSQGNYRWNDIEITWEDKNIDFYVIINKPIGNNYVANRTIIFHMEPWCGNQEQTWGVKTWGEWSNPDESKFLQIRNHKNYLNNCFWQLSLTYNDLKNIRINKTKLFSTICSSKYFDPGHIKRIDFLKYIESKNADT